MKKILASFYKEYIIISEFVIQKMIPEIKESQRLKLLYIKKFIEM
jgi:hypothetical protein